MLRRKAIVFLYQNLIMRCYVTVLTQIYADLTFFGSGPGFVNRTQSDPGFVNLVRSGPGFVNPIRSDPIRSGPDFVNTLYETEISCGDAEDDVD